MSELPSESNWPAVVAAITERLRQVEQDRDEQRRIKDEAFDRLAQVIRERDEALTELAKVNARELENAWTDASVFQRERDEARAAFEALATWLVLPGQVEIGDTPKARRLVYGRELTAQLKRPEHQTITAILSAAHAAADAFWAAQTAAPEPQEIQE